MNEDIFKNFGKNDPAEGAGKPLSSVLDQERTGKLDQLTTEISVWALKEQTRMQTELQWLQSLQEKVGLTAVQADTNATATKQLAGKVDTFYKELS